MTSSDSEVYEKYADELVWFASGLVGPGDAADVVADTFAKAISSVRWDRIDEPRAYLYRAVLNQVRMRHRSMMRRRAREMRAAPAEAVDPPEIRPDVLVTRRRIDDGVSPALDAAGCVLVLNERIKCAFVLRPCQSTPMARRAPRPNSPADH